MIVLKKANFVTTILVVILSVVVSVVWAGSVDEVPPAKVVVDSVETTTDTVTAELTDKVIVYYLHGHRRCATCIKLEAYSKEAIETGFEEELEQGGLEWRVVDYEEEGNEHYADTYALFTKAVILSHISDGQETGWKNLDKIWDLVGDKEKFIEYVKAETKAFLSEDTE
ncbi:MAG: hypothetical protein J7J98_02285 [candidate division Zixibacteria bacterium]|nr:hypothetical protein [candidate division Zixibacteria bacterium]